jgi:hypothetical protein
MRVVMDVQRSGQQYQGSLTRQSDQLSLPFVGMLELLAVLERLERDESAESAPSDRIRR